jgi:Lon protease-like protein
VVLRSILGAVEDARQRRERESAIVLPIFPLGTILCPGGSMSVRVFEARYMDMVKLSLKQQTPFGVCLIRSGNEVGEPATPEMIGTIAQIDDWDMPQQGILLVRVSGGLRFRILSHAANARGLIVADVVTILDDASSPSAALQDCAAFLARIVKGRGQSLDDPLLRLDDAFWVGMRLIEMLPLGNEVKQKMLELTDATMRLELMQRFLQDQGLLAVREN